VLDGSAVGAWQGGILCREASCSSGKTRLPCELVVSRYHFYSSLPVSLFISFRQIFLLLSLLLFSFFRLREILYLIELFSLFA
jgi:hypothetical protein